MHNFDFSAHNQLANNSNIHVQQAVQVAQEKSHLGQFFVCISKEKDVLVLPEFSLSMRDDIIEVVYDSDVGYLVASN